MEIASLEDIFTHEAPGFSGSKQTTCHHNWFTFSQGQDIWEFTFHFLTIWEGKKDLTLE